MDTTRAEVVARAFHFFEAQGLTLDLLAMELGESFAPLNCLPIDSEKMSATTQISVNSLESPTNPYRAVFAVDMLNEGWDVLNLFDIVRLYDTRDAKGGKPGRSTLQEAQLIGRGARYCPFRLDADDDPFTRKFDDDLANELRVCEELYFHSATNIRYIDELQAALRQTGALPEASSEVIYQLKDAFRASDLYRHGWVFVNERLARNRDDITELPAFIRDRQLTIAAGGTGASRTVEALGQEVEDVSVALNSSTCLFGELPPAVRATALRRDDHFRFDRLRPILPNLSSMNEFSTSASYIGQIRMTLRTGNATPTPDQWLQAADAVLRAVARELKKLSLDHFGSREFRAKSLAGTIGDRTTYIANPAGDGVGIPQSRVREDLRLDLSTLDWFGYTENYGTTEEKRFLVYFNGMVTRLRERYDLVVVLRNERQLSIYDFDTGQAFQPDFLLILRETQGAGYHQYQVFVEPKGGHLAATDRWKEELLLRLESQAVAVKTFVDDNEYRVWGLPFYTHEPPQNLRRFADALDALVVPAPPAA